MVNNVVDGCGESKHVRVISGVPQGTVLGPVAKLKWMHQVFS